MITFTPLSGGARLSKTVPLCYLLQVDDVRILLDCGSPDWCPEPAIFQHAESSNNQHDYSWASYCKALKECAPIVDLVLISHGDLRHSGLYAYAYAHWGLRAPTYTTLPVQATARITAQEEAEMLRAEQDVDYKHDIMKGENSGDNMDVDEDFNRKFVAAVEDIREAYDAIHTLRFSQPAHLQGKCQGLTITAFNAGHTLGGTIWKIRSPSAGTILYAVDLNHLRERHLDGTVILRGAGTGGVYETLARPDLFITDADRVNNISCRKKDRDAQLIDTVTSTLFSRHSVMIPCDASTRLLELLVLLDQHWSYSRLKYPICLVSRTGREMLTFVRSMMEWLGGTISKEDIGEEAGNNKRRREEDNEDEALGAFALRFKHLEFFPTSQTLMNTYSAKDPKLILAVPLSLSHGSSREILALFALVPDNVLLLASPGEEGTLARHLFDIWNEEQRDGDKWNKGKLGRNIMLDRTLKLPMRSKVPLQGAELEEYLQKERAAKEKEAAEEAALARTQRMLEADEGDSESDESDDEDAVEQSLNMLDMSDDHDPSTPVFVEPGAGTGRRRSRKDVDMGDWGFETEDGGTKQMLSFDIYMKGNVSKQTSFFKADGGHQVRFRMFPYLERRRRVDSYGEVIDVGMWLRKGKVFEEEAESEESKEAKRRQEEEEKAKEAPAEPPSKYITQHLEVQLACRLLFVDMEGLNDGRAVKKIVAHVNPRKLIIVHSPPDGTESLKEACGAVRALTKDIYAPDIGEQIQIGQHTNSFSISLSEELLASVKMSNFEDNEVGFIQGCIASHASSTIPILEPILHLSPRVDARVEEVPVETGQFLKRSRLGSRPATKLPRSTMIGDLKLTVLKARLTSIGLLTEFAGEGVLLCRTIPSGNETTEEIVVVRKKGDGKVELEGTATDVYYRVRRAIYELHALVAA